jgi:histidinol-phosphate aminotransferase
MAEKCTQKTKIIFIANPDNPTGTYLNHQEVYEFIKKIPKNILIYLDEAYCDFAPQDFPKSLNFLRKYPNIIIARTFSKVFGLAGLRIGYCVTTKTIAAMLEKVRDPFNTNRFAQTAALAALKNEDFLKKVVSHVLKEKKFLYKGFNKLGISYIESATNFILVDFRKDTLPFYNYLLKNGVIIRLMSGWGLKNFFRVTVGLHKENKKFINCLKTYLHNTEVKQ